MGKELQFYEAALKTTGVKSPEDAILEVKDAGGWMVHAMYFSLGLKYDFRDELKKVKAPVLVLHGEKDVMPSSVSQKYADYFLAGKFKLIPGASHFPFSEKPEEFSGVVAAFLKNSRSLE
ncbi:MAG: alpha/beta hydrolase [Candidatus Aminicenantes bacterium]|nr:MAG: alpha/beta hydrolase [Candidatus Aminicenantes bacterium]